MEVPYAIGNTMTCNDFYETQGRLDGAFCDFSNDDKLGFIQRAHDKVVSIYIVLIWHFVEA